MKKQKKDERDTTIRGSIQKSNKVTMLIMLVIIICTAINLFLIYLYARNLKNYTESTQQIKDVEIHKGVWVTNLVEAVT